MADADEGEVAGFLLPAHGVGEPEVRMTDHPEHVGHTPRHHGLDHHVGDGALVLELVGDVDVDAVGAHFHREAGRRVGEAGRWRPGERVVVVAVPRAAEPALLDRTLPERTALVRTAVVERAVVVTESREDEAAPTGEDRAYAPGRQVVDVGDLVPRTSVHVHAGSSPP